MSELSSSQKDLIARWVNDGLSLSDVQKRIVDDFGIHMTYMEVRFLVDDLDLSLKDKEVPKPQAEVADKTPAANAAEAPPPGDFVDEAPVPAGLAPEAPAGAPRVRLSVEPIQKPGVLVGGSVTFSDGQSGAWQMDQYGQLGFVPPYPGYKPAPADVQQFQVELDKELRKLGY